MVKLHFASPGQYGLTSLHCELLVLCNGYSTHMGKGICVNEFGHILI